MHTDSRCPCFACSLNHLTLLIYNYLLNFMPQDCFWRQIMRQEILLDFREKDGRPFPYVCLNCSGRNRDVGLEPKLNLNIYISLDSISFRVPCGAIYMLTNPRNNSWTKTHFLSKKHMDLELELCDSFWFKHFKVERDQHNLPLSAFTHFWSLFWTKSLHKVMGLKRKEKKRHFR